MHWELLWFTSIEMSYRMKLWTHSVRYFPTKTDCSFSSLVSRKSWNIITVMCNNAYQTAKPEVDTIKHNLLFKKYRCAILGVVSENDYFRNSRWNLGCTEISEILPSIWIEREFQLLVLVFIFMSHFFGSLDILYSRCIIICFIFQLNLTIFGRLLIYVNLFLNLFLNL